MDVIVTLAESAPNLLGLLILAFVLWQQVKTLTGALITKVDTLESKVDEINGKLDWLHQMFSREIVKVRATPSSPPYTRSGPQEPLSPNL